MKHTDWIVYESTQSAYELREGPPRKKRGFWKGCFVTLFWLLLIVALLAGAGYWTVQTGRVSLIQVSALLTGVGKISVVNTADADLRVKYIRLDTEDGIPDELSGETVASFDMGGMSGLEPGRYRLDFSAQEDQPPPVSCTLAVGRGDSYTFVAVPAGIAVVRGGQSSQSAQEVAVESSSLCQQ